ncbi:hypothetical protein CLI73_06320, partial [Porphyromonas gingivalis]
MQPVSIMGKHLNNFERLKIKNIERTMQKQSKHLNNFERLSILEDYLSGSDSKVAIEQKYGLSHGLIRSWLS